MCLRARTPPAPPTPIALVGTEAAEEHDKKIGAALRRWNNAGPVRESFAESYLFERGITLGEEEPWLRANDETAYWARSPDGKAAIEVATLPTLARAATIAGAGELMAVAEIFFGHTDDGRAILKPEIRHPITQQQLWHKPVRGRMKGAGVYGLNLRTSFHTE